MKNKYLFVVVLLLLIAFAGYGFTRAYVGMEEERNEEELLIVTSFYPIYIATQNIVNDCNGVMVKSLSEPQTGCLHDYQLTPQDMILLSQADIFVVNGGGMETFLTEVAEENPELVIIDAGAQILPETESDEDEKHSDASHDHDEHHHQHQHGENAHLWMNISHYKEQIETIRDGLMEADALRENMYFEGAKAYLKKVEVLEQEAKKVAEEVQGEPVVVLHEAFELFAEDYGFHVVGTINLDEERQVSAGEVADILHIIEEKNVKIILAEDLYGKDMGDTIEAETDCSVYYLDTLVRGDGARHSWLAGMEQNIQLIKKAFGITE